MLSSSRCAACAVHAVPRSPQEYKPAKLSFGRPHPDPVVETASLAAVEPPDITYQLKVGGFGLVRLPSDSGCLNETRRVGSRVAGVAASAPERSAAAFSGAAPRTAAPCCLDAAHGRCCRRCPHLQQPVLLCTRLTSAPCVAFFPPLFSLPPRPTPSWWSLCRRCSWKAWCTPASGTSRCCPTAPAAASSSVGAEG